jgi:hypothetical protein
MGQGRGVKGPNTYVRLKVQVLRDVVQDNRQHLVSQNMLQKGHDKQQAELEISRLLDVLDVGRSVSLQLSAAANQLQLEISLTIDALEQRMRPLSQH